MIFNARHYRQNKLLDDPDSRESRQPVDDDVHPLVTLCQDAFSRQTGEKRTAIWCCRLEWYSSRPCVVRIHASFSFPGLRVRSHVTRQEQSHLWRWRFQWVCRSHPPRNSLFRGSGPRSGSVSMTPKEVGEEDHVGVDSRRARRVRATFSGKASGRGDSFPWLPSSVENY